MIQAGLLGNGTDQARAVRPRAGTENMTFRKAALLSERSVMTSQGLVILMMMPWKPPAMTLGI